MSFEVGAAHVTIFPKLARGFSKTLGSAGQQSGQVFGDQVTSGFKTTFNAIIASKIVSVVASGISKTVRGAFTGGWNRLMNIEQAEIKLKTIFKTGETSVAQAEALTKQAMKSVDEAVTGTKFAISDAADMASQLAAANIQPGQQMTRWLKLTADAAQFTNRGFGDMQAVLGRVAAEGRVTGETFQSMPVAAAALAQHLGKSQQEVRKLASQGKISADDLVEALEQQIGGAASNAGASFEAMAGNIRTAFNAIGANLLKPFKNAMMPIMGSFLGIAKGFRDEVAKPVGESLDEWLLPKAENFAKTLEKIPSAMQTAVGPLQAFADAWKANDGEITNSGLAGFMELLAVKLRGLVDDVKAFGAGFAEGFGGFDKIAETFQNLLPLITGPLGLIKTALVDVFTDVQLPDMAGLGESFGASLAPILGGVGELAGVLTGALAGAFQQIIPLIMELAVQLLPVIADVVQQLIPLIVQIVATMGPLIVQIVSTLAPILTQFVAQLIPPLAVLIKQVVGVVVKLASALMPLIVGIVSQLLPVVAEILEAILPSLVGLIENVVGLIEPIGDLIVSLIEVMTPIIETLIGVLLPVLATLVETILPILIDIISVVVSVLGMIISALAPIVDIIGAVLTPIIQVLGAVVSTVFGAIQATISTVMNIISAVISGVINSIKGTWDTVWGAISATATSVWDGIKNGVTTAINAVKSVIESVVGTIRGIWEGAWNIVKSTVDNIWGGIKTGFESSVSAIRSTFNKIGDAVKAPFKAAFNAVADFWNNTVGKLRWDVPDWIPGPLGGKTIGAPQLPKLATGGLVTAPTIALVGEAGHEAVLPLDKVQPMLNQALHASIAQLPGKNPPVSDQPINLVFNDADGNLIGFFKTLISQAAADNAFAARMGLGGAY